MNILQVSSFNIQNKYIKYFNVFIHLHYALIGQDRDQYDIYLVR